ncbi:MAG: hypothetical protein LDL07_09565 [Desulfarculus sp.]|nr:hypothetical protein [Desulfarculus sp.]
MAKRGFDVVMVRRSGPVSSFSLRGGFFYLLTVLLAVLTAGLGLCGWVVYQQHGLVMAMVDESRMLSLRAERLEALLQEQETREILAQQAAEERATPPEKGKRGVAPASAAPVETVHGTSETAADLEHDRGDQPEPTTSDYIALRNIEQKLEGGDLVVNFDMVNERESKEPVSGYITLVARGVRNGKPWIEAWPPMRLTNQGRPQSFRRGTPFSVQRYRHVRARVAAIGDKQFNQLEFVIYSRQGELVMVHHQPVNLGRAGVGN